MTEFYRQDLGLVSAPVRRALAFKYLMENKTIYIGEGELIVGEKGPAPKATPTYPELCCHTLQDLDILELARKNILCRQCGGPSALPDTVIPCWQGKSMRDLILREMTAEWQAAYEAGIFTEFMEQRSPGHTVLDDKIYHKGMLDFKADIQHSLAGLDFSTTPTPTTSRKNSRPWPSPPTRLIRFGQRHAEKARELARQESIRSASGIGAHRRDLRARSGTRAPHFLGGAAILLVRPSGRHHRTESLGCV